MKLEEFYNHWTLNYTDYAPISYLFKHTYSERWFRIHSLPKSKRYAVNNTEWKILLSRQNEIITDMFGLDTPIVIVTGEYNFRSKRTIHITEEEPFKPYSFKRLENIDLHKVDPEQHTEDEVYSAAFA